MEDTIADMDIKKEQEDIKREFLDKKIGLPDSKVTDEMNKLGLNKILSKRKADRIMDILRFLLDDHKYIKKQKTKELTFSNESFVLIKIFLQERTSF